jgi:hypothetical protein
MSSFLENENEMIIDAIYSEIGEQLVEDWVNSNLDEGQLYADWCFADMSNSNYIKGRFNQFHNLGPTDNYYLQWDEEA